MSAILLAAVLALQPAAHQVAAGPAPTPGAVNPIAAEPLFADVIARATALRTQVETYRAGLTETAPLPQLAAFRERIDALAAVNQTASDTVRARGVDGDLACILQGISLDLRYRMGELEKAQGKAARDAALKEMLYLLRDNVEVIQAPPAAPV